METNVKGIHAQSMFEQTEAVRLENIKNQKKQDADVELDRRKKQNTKNINSQLTPNQKKMNEKFEADDKMVKEALKTMNFKAMSGKKNRVVPLKDNKFKIYVGNKEVGVLDKNKMSDEDFNNTVYNYMMQKYENTRNTTFAK